MRRPSADLIPPMRAVARHGRRVSASVKYLGWMLAGRLRRIPMSLVMDEYAFSLAPQGWHYLRALAAEYDRCPAMPLEETTFFRFFRHERIQAVKYLDDLLFLHDPARCARHDFKFYFGTYPWGDFWTRYSVVGGKPWGHHYDRVEGKDTRDLYGYRRNPWHQPGDPHALQTEWRQTVRLLQSLRKGYRPRWHGSFPEVVLLVRADGAVRAVRCEGHHRLSVLSHLGHDEVTVLIPSTSLAVVRETEVDRWYYVRRGLCGRETALAIFNAFFELDGRERVRYLELDPVY